MINPYSQFSRHLSYQFKDESLLIKALSHRSVGSDNNERLEFLGDAVLGQIIAAELFYRYPNLDEGSLTRLRSAIVRSESLYNVAELLDIKSVVLLGEGERKSGGRNRRSILADTVEALIGAIYLDSGIDAARTWVLTHFESILNAQPPKVAAKDAKTHLQEVLQAGNFPLPEYDLVETSGKDHERVFTIRCSCKAVEKNVFASAASRRKAEQAAAELMLQQLGVDRHA